MQLKSGNAFKCEITATETDAFKIVKWKKATYETTKDVTRQISFGDIEIFEPSAITLRRLNKSLFANIRSTTGVVRYGFASKDWILWFISQMRRNSIVHLIINENKFTNGFAINQGNFGPSCVDFENHPEFTSRCIRTYLDNDKNFFFA